jgi:hypothetical protein
MRSLSRRLFESGYRTRRRDTFFCAAFRKYPEAGRGLQPRYSRFEVNEASKRYGRGCKPRPALGCGLAQAQINDFLPCSKANVVLFVSYVGRLIVRSER